MKKLIIVFALFFVLFYSANIKPKFSLLNYFSGNYACYTEQKLSSDSTNLGFCYLNKTTPKNNLLGESIVIENLEIGAALSTLNASVTKTEYLSDGTTVIYAYSNLIPTSINLNNEKINLQIATKNDISTIGWPLILGSF